MAINHQQIKGSSRGSFLLADQSIFHHITNQLLSIDYNTLENLIACMKTTEHTVPKSEGEQLYYDVIWDLDHVSGRVEGSATTRKYMQNELWSMLAFLGAPTWYITLSPADIKHPIAIYLAQYDEIIRPQLKLEDRQTKLLADNSDSPSVSKEGISYMLVRV